MTDRTRRRDTTPTDDSNDGHPTPTGDSNDGRGTPGGDSGGGRGAVLALVAANAVSAGGTAMTFLAIPWFVLQTTGSAAHTGLVSAAESTGLVLSAALGGPVIDRLGARRASIAADLPAAVVVAAIPVLYRTVGLPLWLLAALAVALGLTRAPGSGARYALLPAVVRGSGVAMERATGGYEGAARAARMLGGSLAGAVILFGGPPAVLYADAASFLLCALTVRLGVPDATAPRDAATRPGGSWARRYAGELRDGLRYLRRDRVVSGFCLLTMVTNGLDSGYGGVLLPVYTRTELHANALAMGLMVSVFSLGALAGSTLYGWRGGRLRRWPTFTACFLIGGAPRFAALLLYPPVPVLLVVSAACGTAFGVLNPIMSTIEYSRIPADLRGRVLSTGSALAMLGVPVGAAVCGVVLDAAGLAATVAGFGAVYLLATLAPMVLPSWRGMDGRPGAPAPGT